MDRNRDHTEAAALQIASQYLIRMGWSYSLKEVGTRAREILAALDQAPKEKSKVSS